MEELVNILETASEQQKLFDADTAPKDRKERGHFGTPNEIASFMADLFACLPDGEVRVLDAGAGVGTLAAAVCSRILKRSNPTRVSVELWENDARLLPRLSATMDACRNTLARIGHSMDYEIRDEDFILGNTQRSLFSDGPQPRFDLAILNPPYFKLRKDSAQAQAMQHIVHGQPNIYSCFMAVATDLLVDGGEMVAITPRSYFNGPYFRRFRNWFFDRMHARQIHVFESRSDAFQEDAVLQENVILTARRGTEKPAKVKVSTSAGRDISQLSTRTVPYESVIDDRKGESLIRVVGSELDQQVLNVLDKLPDTLETLGLATSTGPVVTFRATEFLREERGKDTAPLLWMHNVRPFVTRTTSRNGKPSHIEVSEASKRLLVPATRYVLLKRFTSKEEKKRLVAGIMEASDSYSDWVGLENHLNYLYRQHGEMAFDETRGIAAYLNTVLADRYFRAISGNTQVNAGELRILPMPSQPMLNLIGRRIADLGTEETRAVEQVVARVLGISTELVIQLTRFAESAK